MTFHYFIDSSGFLMGAYDNPHDPEIQSTWVEVDIAPEVGSAQYINGAWDMSEPYRRERNMLLEEVDAIAGNALRWSSLDAATQAEWATYRQALLDVPQQSNFPHDITWPTKPE